MKKTSIIRLITIVTAFMMMLGLLPSFVVSAAYENTHVNTGNYAYDIVQVAKTQVGYVEGANNDTKYNRWFGSLPGYGYNYAWCQTFVAWCAAQAGVPTSLIPRVSGTISAKDTFKKNGTYHAGPYEGGSYTPKAGDIIYFYSSESESKHHVGIVSGCSDGTVYTIEGNSSNKVVERSYSVSNGNIRGYGVPFSEPVPPVVDPPTISNISIDKNMYAIGEDIIFHVSSDTATSYTIGIHKNGNPYDIIWNYTENNYSYHLTETGSYYAYVSASNEAGYLDSSGIWFTVYDSAPSESVLSIQKDKYSVGENIDFLVSSDTATSYTIGIHKNGEPYDILWDFTSDSYTYNLTEAGYYYAYVSSSNNYGYLDSKGIWFTVYDTAPSQSVISIDKSIYKVGEDVVFHVKSDVAIAYSIGLYKDGIRYESFWDFTEDSYTYNITEEGNYYAYVTAYNEFGYKDSEKIFFTVYENEIPDLNQDGSVTILDAVLLQKHLLNFKNLTAEQLKLADINSDGRVNILDMSLLKAKLQ
ncbi:MAG: dockerin type I domain-containing protein [Ruminococcus sp.]